MRPTSTIAHCVRDFPTNQQLTSETMWSLNISQTLSAIPVTCVVKFWQARATSCYTGPGSIWTISKSFNQYEPQTNDLNLLINFFNSPRPSVCWPQWATSICQERSDRQEVLLHFVWKLLSQSQDNDWKPCGVPAFPKQFQLSLWFMWWSVEH